MKKSAKAKVKIKAKSKAQTKVGHFESHWGIFSIQGVIALLIGAYLLFSGESSNWLINVTGFSLIALGVVEIINILHRHRNNHSWGTQLAISLVEAAIGVVVIISDNHVLHIALLAGYALVDGVTSMVIGFTNFTNYVSRFFWVACGMVSSVIAFVIFADQGLSETTFIKLFATFLMVLGLTSVFFAIHSRDELKKLKSGKK